MLKCCFRKEKQINGEFLSPLSDPSPRLPAPGAEPPGGMAARPPTHGNHGNRGRVANHSPAWLLLHRQRWRRRTPGRFTSPAPPPPADTLDSGATDIRMHLFSGLLCEHFINILSIEGAGSLCDGIQLAVPRPGLKPANPAI